MRFINLRNRRYGKLVVLRFHDRQMPRGRIRWRVRCDCGVKKVMRADFLKPDSTCGCSKIIHGLTGTRTHQSWRAARYRCENPKAGNFDNYGGRGITFYKPWQKFMRFLADVGIAPTENHSLDRIDPDGNYEPGNVRWATSQEQAMNKRKHKVYVPVSEDDNEWAF